MAIGKFHGVMMPTTPTGSRVISTSTPGRTDGTISPARRRRFAGEELEDLAGAGRLADALGQGLAFLARQQLAELFLAREDLVADALAQNVVALQRGPSATRPGTPPSPRRSRASRRRRGRRA